MAVKKRNDGDTDIDKTLRLLALVAVRSMKLREQVSSLSRAGFDRNEMAKLLATTPNSISVRLNELKKDASKREAPRKKAPVKPEA